MRVCVFNVYIIYCTRVTIIGYVTDTHARRALNTVRRAAERANDFGRKMYTKRTHDSSRGLYDRLSERTVLGENFFLNARNSPFGWNLHTGAFRFPFVFVL